MKRKSSIISAKAVEDFYIADKSNINFWVARLEKYSPERVRAVCRNAGTDDLIAEDIVKEIDRYADSRIKMSDVRPLIFNLLQRKDPKAAKKFRAGEIYVRTSKEVIERFDKDRISDSLVKETGLDEKIAEEIAKDTETFIKKENLDFVSSSLVREIANIKLLERGLERERKLYTRVGMPVYDLENLILRGSKENANLQYNPETIHKLIADQSSKQYTLTKLLSLELADAHMNGEIHIHDLDYFPYRPFCFSHDIRFFMKNGFKPDGTGLHTSVAGPAKHPKVLLLHAAKALAAAQTNFGGGQGFSYFNTFLSPMISGLNYKEVKQLAQLFIYEMSQTYIARGGQSLHANDMVWISTNIGFESVKIGEFVNNLLEKNKHATLKSKDIEILKTSGMKTISLDSKTMKFKEFNITGVSRHKPRKKDLYEIKTKSGKNVRVTDFHSIYTIKNNKIIKIRANELKNGDFVLVPKKLSLKIFDAEIDIIDILKRNAPDNILKNIYVRIGKKKIPIKEFSGDSSKAKIGCGISKHATRSLEFSGKIKLNENIATLLGLFVGDGNFRKIGSNNHYIFLSIPKTEQMDEKIRKIVENLGFENFKRINDIDIRFGSEILKIVFQYAFKTGRTSIERTVPPFIFSASDAVALSFLRALYSTDGSIYYKNPKTIGIEYDTINKNLANSLCLLLSRFEIVPDIEERKRYVDSINGLKLKTHPRNQFRLMINSNEQKKIFAEKIGFLQKRKLKLCDHILKQNHKIALQHHTRRIPRELVYSAFRDMDVNIPLPIISSRNIYSWNVNRELEKIPHNTPESTKMVERLIDSDIGMDEIVSIKKIPASKFVYDLEVAPKGRHIENFLGGFGSILVSNTVFSSIDLDMHVPELFRDIPAIGLGGKIKGTYSDYEDETNKLFNAFLDVYMEGDYRGKPFNFPKFEMQIYPKDLDKNDEDLLKVSQLAAKYGTPYYIINQPYMPKFACYQSMPFDEKILLLKDNCLVPTKIGEYVDNLMKREKIEIGEGLEGKVELVKSSDYVVSFNTKTLKVDKRKITKLMRHKNKENIFKLILDGNRTISATQKHKIHVVRDNKIVEVRFENIKEGDFVIGLKNLNVSLSFDNFLKFNDKKIEIDCELARLLGYFAAEGYIHAANKKNRMNKLCFSFNTNEKVYIKDVCNILKKKFNIKPKFDISIKNNTTTIYVYDKQMVELFVHKIGIGTDAHTKRVPKAVFSFPPDLVKEFLLGMFRGDGYCGKNIDLHLCNKDLIEDIFLLNLRLGIPFEFLENRGKFDSYSLRLSSKSRIKQFLDFVPFSNTDGGLPKKTFDFYDRIPTKPFNIRRKNLRTGHWNRCQLGKRATKKRLKEDDNLYSKFIRSDLHLFEVKKIEVEKSEYVYDLVDVEKNHNFSNSHGIFSSNCCAFLMPLGESSDDNDIAEGTVRGGSLQVITVNLPQIAYGANGDDARFFEILDDRFEKAKKVMILRYKIIDENLRNAMLPFLSQKVNERGDRYLEPKKQSYTIGIVGINEMVKYHTGEELHESLNAWKFGLKAMKYMKQKVAEFREETGLNFALARTPAESSATRLASIDKKRFGKRAIMQGEGKGIYYTNSFHVRPNANIPLFKRLEIEGAFHPLTDGGAMCLDYNEKILVIDKTTSKIVNIGDFVEKRIKKKRFLSDGAVFDNINEVETIGLNKENKIERIKILNIMKIPAVNEDVFEIKTKNNKKLKCVGKHKIFKLDNGEIKEVFVKDMKKKDTIIMLKDSDIDNKNIYDLKPKILSDSNIIFGKNKSSWRIKNTKRRYCPTKIRLDRKFGEMIGFMVSEGFKTASKKTIANGNYNVGATFGFHEDYYADYFMDLVTTIFGNNGFKKDKNINTREITVKTSNKTLHYLFSNIFDIGEGAKKRIIPNEIILSNKNVLMGLLDAAFAGDGTIDKRNNKFQPIYDTTSKKLADGISFIASLCGYENSKSHVKRSDGREFYAVTLLRDSGSKFIKDSKLFKRKINKTTARKSTMNGYLLNYSATSFENLSKFYIKNRKIGKYIDIHNDEMKKILYLQYENNITTKKTEKIIHGWVRILNKIKKLNDILCGYIFHKKEITKRLNISERIVERCVTMFKRNRKYVKNCYFSKKTFDKVMLNAKQCGIKIKNKLEQDMEKLEKFSGLINNLGFDIIKDIKITKPHSKWVYDIQTKTGNFFTTEGILNHNSHIWLGEAYPNAEAIMELTKKIARKTAIQYMAFTKDLTICNDCNFVVGGLHDVCPKCNSGNIQQWSRITGYYQNIAGWNEAKKQELKDRKRYMVA